MNTVKLLYSFDFLAAVNLWPTSFCTIKVIVSMTDDMGKSFVIIGVVM
jgi:hypothetical protein